MKYATTILPMKCIKRVKPAKQPIFFVKLVSNKQCNVITWY